MGRLSFILLASIVVVAGCGLDESDQKLSESNSVGRKTFDISADWYGVGWPLDIGSGTLGCEGGGMATFKTGATIYALNGYAITHGLRRGWVPVDAVWKTDPKSPGARMQMDALIDMAVGLCGGRTPAKPTTAPTTPKIEAAIADEIVVTRFKIKTRRVGKILTVALDTDLPTTTKIMVSVDRGYRRKGSNEVYIAEYFSTSTTVEALTNGIKVDLDIDLGIWKQRLERIRLVLAAAGEPRPPVVKVDDSLTVSMIVPIDQAPPFEQSNRNLKGKFISDWIFPIIDQEVSVSYPASVEEKNVLRQ